MLTAHLQRRRTEMIVASLARAGDDGRTPREVMHYIRPGSGPRVTGERAIRKMAAVWGMSVAHDATGEGLRLIHSVSVAAPYFTAFTVMLVDAMAAEGWSYEGWESPVVKGD